MTLQGYIVISVGFFGDSKEDEVLPDGTKDMPDEMHKRKIDMADEIYIINKNLLTNRDLLPINILCNKMNRFL